MDYTSGIAAVSKELEGTVQPSPPLVLLCYGCYPLDQRDRIVNGAKQKVLNLTLMLMMIRTIYLSNHSRKDFFGPDWPDDMKHATVEGFLQCVRTWTHERAYVCT
jgi:hypothetical protein